MVVPFAASAGANAFKHEQEVKLASADPEPEEYTYTDFVSDFTTSRTFDSHYFAPTLSSKSRIPWNSFGVHALFVFSRMNSVKKCLPGVHMMKRLKTHPDLFFVVLSQRKRRKLVKPEITAG